jgi:hypothetical protein
MLKVPMLITPPRLLFLGSLMRLAAPWVAAVLFLFLLILEAIVMIFSSAFLPLYAVLKRITYSISFSKSSKSSSS